MSTEIAERRSLIETMAATYGLSADNFFKTIKETVFSGKGSDSEMMAFMLVANRYQLDPFCREIYAFPKTGGGIQNIVGVDGWLRIINGQETLDGIEYADQLDEKGALVSVTCRIFRKDRSHPIECTEYMAECKRNTQPWSQWPRRMLRHKATIQCARIAFSLSGIVDPDEAERVADGMGAVMDMPKGARIAESKLNKPKVVKPKETQQPAGATQDGESPPAEPEENSVVEGATAEQQSSDPADPAPGEKIVPDKDTFDQACAGVWKAKSDELDTMEVAAAEAYRFTAEQAETWARALHGRRVQMEGVKQAKAKHRQQSAV